MLLYLLWLEEMKITLILVKVLKPWVLQLSMKVNQEMDNIQNGKIKVAIAGIIAGISEAIAYGNKVGLDIPTMLFKY